MSDIPTIAEIELSRWQDMATQRTAYIKDFWAKEKPRANWCAAFASYVLRTAGVPVPERGGPVRGARALTRWIAKHGEWVIKPQSFTAENAAKLLHEHVWPGDVICWPRVRFGWQCHVGIIVAHARHTGCLDTIEGNSSSAVQRHTMTYNAAIKRLKGLYGVARISPT